MTNVRLATPADIEAIADTVALAFAGDPAWTFILGADDMAARRAFATALLVPRIRRGTTWVADECRTVAMWDRWDVHTPRDDDHDERWAAFREFAGEEVSRRLDVYDSALAGVEPARPHWYLGALATHPDVQGRGLATAVLEPGFAAIDSDGWDCWLDTSTTANKAFYARRGFTESHVLDIEGCPPTWWMRRPSPST